MNYAYSRQVGSSVEDAILAIKDTLAERGFGVLTEIDVREKLKARTGEDIGPYVILGACSPPDALRAVRAERDIGLLLPCNVVVREESGGTTVSAILPVAAMSFIENEKIAIIAAEVQERLTAAVDALPQADHSSH